MDSPAAPSVNTKPASLKERRFLWATNAIKVLRYAAEHAGEKKLTQVAASLTFTTVLAIVPLLAIVLSLFTAFPLFGQFKEALEAFLTVNLMPPAVSDNVMNYLNQFAAQASGLTAIGSAFLVVVSIMLIMTIDSALNDIWRVQQQRPLRQRMLVYWAIISLGPVLVGASLWATSYLARESLGWVAEIPPAINLVLSSIPLLLTGVGFAALFVSVPNRQVNWRDALAGGFGAAVVLQIMKTGFALYLSYFPSYTVIYGAFATLPIFLLWIYLSWLAVLFGATVAATLPSLRLRRWAENRQPGATLVDAIQVIRLLHQAQGSPSPGRSTRFLSAHLHLHADELLNALNTLKDLGYVVAAQGKKEDQWVLACDVAHTSLTRLVDALLIDRNQPGLQQSPLLLDAISASLLGSSTITLDEVLDNTGTAPLENPVTLPETAVIGQNTNVSMIKQNQETNDVKSQ